MTILNIYFIFKVIAILKENQNIKSRQLIKVFSIMKWYPIIQTIFAIIATVNRLYNLISKESSFPMMILQTICDKTEGLFIVIIFILSPEIKNNLKICCAVIFRRMVNTNGNEIQKKHSTNNLNNTNQDQSSCTESLNITQNC